MIRKIIKARIGVVDKLMVTFDQAGGYGEQLQDSEFWKKDGQKTITAREEM
jgi:hypothetical protein